MRSSPETTKNNENLVLLPRRGRCLIEQVLRAVLLGDRELMILGQRHQRSFRLLIIVGIQLGRLGLPLLIGPYAAARIITTSRRS